MKSQLWAIALLVSATACNADSQPAALTSTSPQIEPAANSTGTSPADTSPTDSAASVRTAASQTHQASPLVNAPANSTRSEVALQLDYEAMTPLPSTGRVTIRDSIRNLATSRLIADCPPDSAPYAFAESTNYQVQICSQEYDPWLPKYYRGRAKDGSGELQIVSRNLDEARQLIFKQDGYSYIIYRDSARPEQTNAYLEIYTPQGQNYAEALIYLYEADPPPP